MRSTTISVWLYLATLTIGSFCTTVKVVDADTINAYAGSGVEGFNGDGIAATTAQLDPESKKFLKERENKLNKEKNEHKSNS